MTDEPTEFDRLMDRIRQGCPEAARELFEKYGDHILKVVRSRLHKTLRPQFDSSDFTQAVWKSFFAIPTEQFAFDTPQALIAFLGAMASHKVSDAYRSRVKSAKRDIRREQQLPVERAACQDISRDPRQPTPSQFAVANEEWERILDGQPSHYRLALELLRLGYSQVEVASRLSINPKQIQRLLQKLNRGSDD